MVFQNRKHAGRLLSRALSHYQNEDAIILALPRGGVPVASEIAAALKLPLDVLIVRKIGAAFQAELAAGAVSEDEEPIWNQSVLSQIGLDTEDLAPTLRSEKEKIKKQREMFRNGEKISSFVNKTAIVVDDGLATGFTMMAAIKYLKKKGAKKIVVAVPVAAEKSARQLKTKVDDVIILEKPADLWSVSQWYDDFSQVSDEEVMYDLHHNSLAKADLTSEINRSLFKIKKNTDFHALVDAVKDKRVVMLGEATHGTAEFYEMRAEISKQLIENHGFNFIAVEGDWPDAYRLNNYIQKGTGKSARDVLKQNHRWPTWMWANEEVAKLAEWMKNQSAAFYGLDVYSLFESIEEIRNFLKEKDPKLAAEVEKHYSCFEPFEGDEISYARSLFKYPAGCKQEVLENLQKLLELRIKNITDNDDELFSSQQNARIIANAEAYYRSMVEADDHSWNVRDTHMMDTLDRLLERHGEGAKGIVWAHNTHIGDYRATDMLSAGYVNIGGLARQSYGEENVALVGFGTYQGQVTAGSAWGGPEKVMTVPPAMEESYEYYFHRAAVRSLTSQYFLLFDQTHHPQFSKRMGHRAIGVVYDPHEERRSNYVPTELSKRYDAFVFVDTTHALKSLHTPSVRGDLPETWPTGM
jgi:erythromycin esterase-like protein/predicted phosphoribosyltransferase